MRNIYVLNKSTRVTDPVVRNWCEAVNTQLVAAAQAWGQAPARARLARTRLLIPPSAWVVLVLDDADQADALGYHTVDRFGRVYGKVFVRTAERYNENPSVTFSHEILETWGDPHVDRDCDTGKGYRVPVELCDAVEGDGYWVRVNGQQVRVSNYLYPAWFGKPNGNGSVFRDAMNTTPAPFELAEKGYTVRTFPDGKTDQVFGETANVEYIQARRHVLARTVRRSSR